MTHMDYIKAIENSPVYDVAQQTSLQEAPVLSNRLGHQIQIKREDTQSVFSFKLRGAYHKIAQLSESQKAKGVITASAGNHAQGVALAAQKLGLSAIIVMPVTTPQIKVNAVKRIGGKVILAGDTYDDAHIKAKEIEQKESRTFIHPYDDPDVIAGQGTVAKEIIDEIGSDFHAIFIPVGGGGLISGMAVYLKHINPKIKIIAVEADNSACLAAALKAKERVILDKIGIFADGVAVKQVGQYPFEVLPALVDECIQVDTDEICAAIKDIYEETRSIVEPAGALSVAGIKAYLNANPKLKNQHLIGITCGANLNFDRLRHIAERAEIGEEREALLAVKIPEKKGSFLSFCKALKGHGITEFNYRVSNPNEAMIFVGIQLQEGNKEKDAIIQQLHSLSYDPIDMTQNEVAKLHLRHMIGGKAQEIKDEKIYRFQFPERPGALLEFLQQLGQNWNISLFHYRNHGAAFGRVLVGIQVPDADLKKFDACIKETQLNYFNETENPAISLFL
ncbi:MAG: threonine ammonia-lyase, biosynthetic [Actinobacteria bacterium]|nr:threonine ammonia-lyase, biosynthetic [Actinomycetota bacterium]